MPANLRSLLVLPAIACLAILASAVWAWWGPGHERATLATRPAIDQRLPAFFVEGLPTVAHLAVDPDMHDFPLTPQLHAAEAPEHYFDLEKVDGRKLPDNRYAFYRMCAMINVEPEKVGLAPYALAEWTQRLTVAFAEHRKWPDNPHIRMKCLVYAGRVAHYGQDLVNPLHCTIHWDGRMGPSGKSPRTGIHERVDALFQKLDPADLQVQFEKVEPFEDVLQAAFDMVRTGNARVDAVYTLEDKLPASGSRDPLTPEIREFTRQRFDEATVFTARLLVTAWEDSAKVELPRWHQREAN